ncbi:MAG: hypothetical protein R3191_03620, partial [Anaerolineales bacterium]|nr:hypothetical protein [Anaerolineales bacterium]
ARPIRTLSIPSGAHWIAHTSSMRRCHTARTARRCGMRSRPIGHQQEEDQGNQEQVDDIQQVDPLCEE